MQIENDIVSVSFDRFPGPKGAATHIEAFATALGAHFGRVQLVTMPPLPDALDWQAAGVELHPLPADGATLFERVLGFQAQLWSWWKQRYACRNARPRVAHIRSIFEGYPIARDKDQYCEQLVYEVNGLPSIELKYHYPAVSDDRELLHKLREQERVCLAAADRIITVSDVNRRHLLSLGVDDARITVIRNGVDLELFPYREPRPWREASSGELRTIRLLYAGTMSSWQGVQHAIEALALSRRELPVVLTLVGPTRPRQRKEILDFAWRLKVDRFLEVLDPVSKPLLAELHHAADVVLAPLTRNDRNCEQGCCPLKVLEALASGTVLIASDLEVVRELCTDGEHALLVRPGSGKAIKDALLRLIAEPDLASVLSLKGREHVEAAFGWGRAQAELLRLYEGLRANH